MLNGAPYFRPDIRGDRFPMVDTGRHWCLTPRCRHTVNKKKEHSPFCYKCRWRIWKEKNPAKYAFGNLRRRAKERGKSFTLKFEEYLEFIKKTDYLKLKGKTGKSISINRINNSLGYSKENIEAISLSDNSRKAFVPFFAHQIENASYKPSDEELLDVGSKLAVDY